MAFEKQLKEKLWILVKAYPQPSKTYQETVCCAGITENGRFLRLYPIRYRHLNENQKFNRFDLIEATLRKPGKDKDKRPESYKVIEDSIVILRQGKDASTESKQQLWLPYVNESLQSLKNEQITTGKSLGIIKPDENSLKFLSKPVNEENADTKALIENAYNQVSLFEKNLTPLEPPEFAFYYKFSSAGQNHTMQIHDWEVQATYRNYKKYYGSSHEALKKMKDFYNERILSQSPYFFMGNMFRSQKQFMIIGILRSSKAPQTKSLFDYV